MIAILRFSIARTVRIWMVMIFAGAGMAANERPCVSYTALSDAARQSGQLARYDTVRMQSRRIALDDYVLEVNIPQKACAYDVIPIRYRFTKAGGSRWAAVEAAAFEDYKKAGQKPLYDLAVPGNMNVKIEYLGSVCADYEHDRYIPLSPNPNTPISPFPPFRREAFICSSTIRPADIIWFKFKITNTGDTILDPEGLGASFAEPYLYKLAADGRTAEWKAQPVNLFIRQLEYLYPGDSVEQWVNFTCPDGLGLKEGDYKIAFRMVARFYDKYDWQANIWSGTEFARLEVPITVSQKPKKTPVKSEFTQLPQSNRMPGYFSAFEEFMTSFKVYQGDYKDTVWGDTLYLQLAPWTSHVVIKLITADPQKIAVAKIPIKLSDKTLAVQYNPSNTMVLKEGKNRVPVFVSMSMPGMRSGFQLGPYPEKQMYEFLKEQKELGVNVIANTAGDWWIPEISGRKGVELSSACYKYFYDVLIRKLDMKVMGWSLYPPSGTQWYVNAEPLVKRKLDYSTTQAGYVVNPSSTKFVDMADPVVPEVIAAWVIYQYQRWGDTWFTTADGRVPVDLEDSWGWLRDDINGRYGVGPLGVKRFRQWLKEKYTILEHLNTKWGTQYQDFEQIDPQAGLRLEHGVYVYDDPNSIFREWSMPLEDWDIFRTELRLEIIDKTNKLIRKVIPNAELAPRTEGANLVTRGCRDGNDMHARHVYYSQRRNAMIYDVIKAKDIVHFYSDYTTLPYTTEQWTEAMRQMTADGVIAMFLPQFDHMRDILLNPYYGREYTTHYNLERQSKGIMVHCLTAAYPWWKATYEAGGAPGIIWSDYLCDGFATETQKRELKLLTDHFSEMKQ